MLRNLNLSFFCLLIGLIIPSTSVFAQPSPEDFSIPVVDNTHPKYGRGKYFTFENDRIDKIVGQWEEVRLLIQNDRTGKIGAAIFWRKPYRGDNSVDYRYGHGRWEDKSGNWLIGDNVIIIQPSNIQIDVISNTHPKYGTGKYFSYETSTVDSILGRTNWDGQTFFGKNVRTERIAIVRLWRRPYHGSNLNYRIGHGRWEDKAGGWQKGDRVLLYYPLNR